MKPSAAIKKQIANLPDTPGVYYFRRGRTILYIGKATSLRDRVRSYYSGDILESRGPKIGKMLQLATNVTYEQVDSVLEALILESRLIKKHQPEYNTREKDDKSYNYIIITDEDFPRVFTIRQRELERDGRSINDLPIDTVYGPFPNGLQLREALRIMRKIFPFRDKKARQFKHEQFYRQIGLAPDTESAEARAAYMDTVKNLKLFLKGQKKTLVRKLQSDMKAAAAELAFERAGQIKKTIFALQHIHDVALIKDDLANRRGRSDRIEAYDVAHTSGQSTVGVMTVVTDGEADRGQYRKFRIRQEKGNSDIDSLRELLERRFTHDEWRYPSLIVVDGNNVHKRLAEKILRDVGLPIPVVAVVKDEKHRPRNILGQKRIVTNNEAEILLANHEAHRFAIQYHKSLRRKKSLGK